MEENTYTRHRLTAGEYMRLYQWALEGFRAGKLQNGMEMVAAAKIFNAENPDLPISANHMGYLRDKMGLPFAEKRPIKQDTPKDGKHYSHADIVRLLSSVLDKVEKLQTMSFSLHC